MSKMISNSSTSNGGGGAPMEGGVVAGSQKGANLQGLKKGPWTAAEDAILIEYVKKHGEGNWNSVRKNSGLMRCGKSCRLRWANHLRPNLKKGSFTAEEERIIIDLHAKLGNKWARMASQLPGRTDNEIKNFWNTRMKRRQRAGLPIYPQEFHQDEPATFHIQQHHHHPHHHHQQQQQEERQKYPNSSSPSFSSVLSSSRKPSASFNPSLSLLDLINFSPALDPLQNHLPSFYSNHTLQFKPFGDSNANNSGLALPLSPYGRSPPSITPLSQNFAGQAMPTSPLPLHFNSSDFENDMSFTSLIMGAQVEPIGPIPGLKSDLTPDQKPRRPSTPFSSNTSGGVCVGGDQASSKNTDNESETAQLPEMQEEDIKNSGLLDALLMESQHLSRKEKMVGENSLVGSDHKGKRVADEPTEEKEEAEKEAAKRLKLLSTNGGEASGDHQCCDDLSSSQSSIGMKPSDQEPMEEMNSIDDDLLSLLDNFPSSTPLPDWYRRRTTSGGLSSGTTVDDHRGLKVEQETSVARTTTKDDTTPNVDWAFGSSLWNNMPGIC